MRPQEIKTELEKRGVFFTEVDGRIMAESQYELPGLYCDIITVDATEMSQADLDFWFR